LRRRKNLRVMEETETEETSEKEEDA